MNLNLPKRKVARLSSAVLIVLLLAGCSSKDQVATSSSWAFPFVVYQGTAYGLNGGGEAAPGDKLGEVTFVFSDEQLEPDVEKFLNSAEPEDRERLRSGIYGQSVPVGTAIYAIDGISPEEAIAVETEKGVYRRAEKAGP
ncbi:hypothetical protein CDO73_05680 [Saccharibacillus sp. O23]|uniref:hypothetical protein n=1 Tax=Saccharibacillus sp. O23 TaxID=2009338 RepID=UPI000B4E7BD9|nr:hypothetical protein [Saccharibacillus sp. O23]OWR31963.1 hypothetical protein CDO73_05680 [Saccharibacillus sp. O23]